jgi:two-component system, response regulator / RNA-binding antiterminator
MLNVLLVDDGSHPPSLLGTLKDEGFDTLKTHHGPLFLSLVKESRPDVIIFDLDSPSDALVNDLLKLNQQFPLPVILFSKEGSSEIIEKIIKADVSSLIIGRINGHSLKNIVQVAMARFKQLQALKEALDEARSQLEDRKQIDRAKAILIKTQHFNENDAYHTLRKLAMDRNITLGEMARNVIAMAALLK